MNGDSYIKCSCCSAGFVTADILDFAASFVSNAFVSVAKEENSRLIRSGRSAREVTQINITDLAITTDLYPSSPPEPSAPPSYEAILASSTQRYPGISVPYQYTQVPVPTPLNGQTGVQISAQQLQCNSLSFASTSAVPEDQQPLMGNSFAGGMHQPKINYKENGIESTDPVLNSDPKALLDFFIANCSPPRLYVNIRGLHVETGFRPAAAAHGQFNNVPTLGHRSLNGSHSEANHHGTIGHQHGIHHNHPVAVCDPCVITDPCVVTDPCDPRYHFPAPGHHHLPGHHQSIYHGIPGHHQSNHHHLPGHHHGYPQHPHHGNVPGGHRQPPPPSDRPMEPYAVDVTDFEVRYDLTQLIDPMGMIYSVPDADNNCRTVSQLLADYTQDDNKFKSLVLTKYILWDYTELQQAIIGAFRSVGYYGEIAITFPKEQYEISVHSAHRMRKLARNNLVRALCFVTCLWVIAGPAYVFSRHRNADTLQATFRMRISPREWLQSNYWSIISNIKCNYK